MQKPEVATNGSWVPVVSVEGAIISTNMSGTKVRINDKQHDEVLLTTLKRYGGSKIKIINPEAFARNFLAVSMPKLSDFPNLVTAEPSVLKMHAENQINEAKKHAESAADRRELDRVLHEVKKFCDNGRH